MDFNWFTSGGIVSDGSGDISFAGGLSEIVTMVASRVKASSEGWQLYDLGAHLDTQIGEVMNKNMSAMVKSQITSALRDILPPNLYQIQTLITGNTFDCFIIINNNAILQITISQQTVNAPRSIVVKQL